MFAGLLDQITDLHGAVITADALHAQREHATCLHERGGHYIFTGKGNQPGLHRQLRSLPWKDVPAGHVQAGRGHGRIEKRTVKAVTVTVGLLFPHAAQAIQITRRTPRLSERKWRTETSYAITSLPAAQARPAQLAEWIRGHRKIENQLHWVRDVTLGEDLSQARTGTGPSCHGHPAHSLNLGICRESDRGRLLAAGELALPGRRGLVGWARDRRSIWASLSSAPARLILSPSTSPSQPSRSASAMRAMRLSRISAMRWPLGRVGPVHGAADAAVFVDARGSERAAAGAGGDLAALEVAEELVPIRRRWGRGIPRWAAGRGGGRGTPGGPGWPRRGRRPCSRG